MWKTDANSVIQTFGKSALSASSNLRECQCLHEPIDQGGLRGGLNDLCWSPRGREGLLPGRQWWTFLQQRVSRDQSEQCCQWMLVLVTVVSAMRGIILLVKVFIRDKVTVLEHSAGMRQLTVVSIVINALSLILPLNHPGAAWNCQLGHWLWQSWLPWSLHRGLFTFSISFPVVLITLFVTLVKITMKKRI